MEAKVLKFAHISKKNANIPQSYNFLSSWSCIFGSPGQYLIHIIITLWTKCVITHYIFLDAHKAFDKAWHVG